MSNLAITAESILRWNDTTNSRWMALLNEQPSILKLPCDVRASGTADRLFQHIVAVELRYAQRLASLPESLYEAIPFHSASCLESTHAQAIDIVQGLLNDLDYDWSVEIEFQTISAGRLRCTRQTVFLHAMMHGFPHYAQLATLIRQQGYKASVPMDYLFVASTPA